jgi:hypothetical protein
VREFEPEFSRFVSVRGGGRATVVGDRYRRAFVPLVPVLGTHAFMIMSAGGDVVSMSAPAKSAIAPAANVR